MLIMVNQTLAVTVERYIAVCRPHQHLGLVTVMISSCFCYCYYLVLLLLSSLLLSFFLIFIFAVIILFCYCYLCCYYFVLLSLSLLLTSLIHWPWQVYLIVIGNCHPKTSPMWKLQIITFCAVEVPCNVIYTCNRVSHITPFFELSYTLLTTHAIGLYEVTKKFQRYRQ